MISMKWLIDNEEAFNESMRKRGIDLRAEQLIEMNKKKNERVTQIQELQSQRNSISKKIGQAKSQGGSAEELMTESTKINERLEALEADSAIEDELNTILVSIPNTLQEEVPFGKDENDNVEVVVWGEPRNFDFPIKQHFELGEDLGLMDFEQTGKLSGARFTTLFGDLARMELALGNFFLDTNKEYGYTAVACPVLVRENTMFGTGNLPKFAEDAFKTTDDRWLIPTSEVYLTNLVQDKILAEKELPLRYTAFTSCFRSEAGSAGKDTRGMLRQHEFKKVEIVSITTPEKSEEEHQRMLMLAEENLKRLGIPYRKILLCSGDTGFGSSKTYDLEVWLPGQDCYREIASGSNCHDFQAMRMNARYKPEGAKKNEFVHTLNCSSLAVGRAMIAIMENYQQEDGSIKVPEALVPYMGGVEVITGK